MKTQIWNKPFYPFIGVFGRKEVLQVYFWNPLIKILSMLLHFSITNSCSLAMAHLEEKSGTGLLGRKRQLGLNEEICLTRPTTHVLVIAVHHYRVGVEQTLIFWCPSLKYLKQISTFRKPKQNRHQRTFT